MFVCVNPSTATASANDPTTQKCIKIAKALNFGGVFIANLFAYRSPYPNAMRRAPAPVGPSNDRLLKRLARTNATVVAAWGVNGAFRGRDRFVQGLFSQLFCLGRTRYRCPRHPLYVFGSFALQPYP